MPVRTVRVLVTLAVVAASLVGLALPAFAATIHVGPGQSIQAAVNSAQPGDTIVVAPGTYRESVVIREDDLTLLGGGSGTNGTILEPPPSSQPQPVNFCTQNDLGLNGFCIAGTLDTEPQPPFEEGGPVVLNTRIEGFLIRNFPDSGILALRARFSRFNDIAASDNAEYGIFALESQGTRIQDSSATGSADAGFYVGDTANSATAVLDSFAAGNGIGIFARDASQGFITGNLVTGNCAGIVLLDTGAPVGVLRWTVANNSVHHNNAACPAFDEAPPLSGIGILLLGTRRTTVEDNVVNNNAPSGPSVVSGGIILASAEESGGPDPRRTVVRENSAHGNQPHDLIWDGSGVGNQFIANDCGTSDPSGLCP
jgi:hypothetical protein